MSLRGPALARALLRWLAPGGLGAEMAAELDEELARHVIPERGDRAARRWYRRQVLGSIPALLGRRLRGADRRSARAAGARSVGFGRGGAAGGSGGGVGRSRGGGVAGGVGLLRDLRQAARALRRTPGFTTAAIATIALGIGATTAMFSAVNGVILRPLPYAEPDRLVEIWQGETLSKDLVSRIREESDALLGVAGSHRARGVLTGVDEPRELFGLAVTANYFDILGTPPALGRTFPPEASDPGGDASIVLGHALWTGAFGADPGAIGRTIVIAGTSRRILGVMPADHRATVPGAQFWIPTVFDPADRSDYEGTGQIRTIGRLADGASLAAADAELARLAARLHDEAPAAYTEEWAARAVATPFQAAVTEDVSGTLWMMFGAVGFVLMIACANVANLLLARTTGRERDLAVRAGLGAGRRRLVRGLMLEAFLLAGAGGLLGLWLAAVAVRAVSAALPPSVLRADAIVLDTNVFVFALVASLVTSLAFGLLPAIRATSGDLVAPLRGSSRNSTPGGRRHRLNAALVAAQIAASTILVTGATLMLRSFSEIRNTDLGFRAEGAVTMEIRVPTDARYESTGARAALFREIDRAVGGLPGVVDAGLGTSLPMAGRRSSTMWDRPDRPREEGAAASFTDFQLVTPGYLEAVGVPLLRGRRIEEADGPESGAVGVINETLARQAFEGEPALGRRLELFGGGLTFEVVGVVADARQERPERPALPEAYVPYRQVTFGTGLSLVARVAGEPGPAAAAIRRAIQTVDPALAVSEPRALADITADAAADSRFFTTLIAAFGALALLLGAIGVYGVLSYVIGERLTEFGIRLALGSGTRRVVRGAIGRGLAPVAVGIAIGLAGALATTRLLESLLFRVTPTDPATFVLVPTVLFVVAGVACYLPARRAARVDPLDVIGAG